MFSLTIKILLMHSFIISIDSYAKAYNTEEIVKECQGCHTEKREQPADGYFSIGLGKWKDYQCYGCHQEITDISLDFEEGKKDQRFYSIPVSIKKLQYYAKNPMSYLKTPLNFEKKFIHERLIKYLKYPFRLNGKPSRSPLMTSYTSIDSNTLSQVIHKLGMSDNLESTDANEESIKKGMIIWKNTCEICHEGSNLKEDLPNYRKLSLLKHDWIYNYSNLKERSRNYKQRLMPKIPITEENAKDISNFLGEKLKKEFEQSRSIQNVLSENTKNTDSNTFSNYIFGQFLRDGSCVHCHSGENRMKSIFEASEQGMLRYFKEKGAVSLLDRLENRKLEQKTGFTHQNPGMPQTKPAFSDDFLNQFNQWIQKKCITQGRELC